MRSRSSVAVLLSLGLGAGLAAPASAQLIGLKTVPLAAGDQFYFTPDGNAGMAGPSIALDDELQDPFVNPAKGARVVESQFFSSPTTYSISEQKGGAHTLPFGVLLTSDTWFGGGVAAFQQLDAGGPNRFFGSWVDPTFWDQLPASNALSDRTSTNKYFQVGVGRRVGEDGLAVAASAMVADLSGTDGVEELFVNAWEIEEFGHVEDYRVGLVGTLSGERTFEAVLVHNRVDLTQDVTNVTWALTDSVNWLWTPDIQEDANLNRSRTWGVHLGYVQPIGDTDWRIGGILTANRKLHPKIPTYDLASVQQPLVQPIPRDPGESWAWDIGVGLSRQTGPATFALDLIYQPAVSDTWADAEADVPAANGTTILAGERTVDNRFVFSNARIATGFAYDFDRATVQLGIRAHHYDYRLRQENHVLVTTRRQNEQWTEWTPTWGFRYRLDAVELRYSGSASSASHVPEPLRQNRLLEAQTVISQTSMDVLAPPTGRLVIPDETTVTHRFAVSLPIR